MTEDVSASRGRRALARRRLSSRVRAVVVAFALAGLSGCAAAPTTSPTDAGSSPSAGALPAGVTVQLAQLRADVAARQAQVQVHNGTDRPLEIGAVTVADARFDGVAERVVERTSIVPGGSSVDIRVQLPPVACDVGDAAESTVTLAFAHGGRSAVAEVPAVDPVPFLAELHERECVQAGAEASASLAFAGFTPGPSGEPGTLALAVTPTAGVGDLRIVGIRETNLLTFRGLVDGVHPLDIDQTGAGRSAVVVALPLLPARCDAHAVQEDKRGTVFRVFVEVGGEAGSFDLAATPGLRGTLLGWVADWCGFGAP